MISRFLIEKSDPDTVETLLEEDTYEKYSPQSPPYISDKSQDPVSRKRPASPFYLPTTPPPTPPKLLKLEIPKGNKAKRGLIREIHRDNILLQGKIDADER